MANIKKRVLSMLLALLMVISLMPMSVFAADGDVVPIDEQPDRYEGYNIYKAEEGHTVDGKALSFKDDVTAYFMYNGSVGTGSYSGMNKLDNPDTVLTAICVSRATTQASPVGTAAGRI